MPWVPSPRGLYSLGRAIDRSPLADGALPPLLDEGAEPNQVMRGVEEWGVRPIQAPTSAGAYSDCEPSNVNDEPTLDELETDSVSMLVGEYEIFSTGTQRVTEVCIALAGGIPVCVAIAGGSDAFQGYSGGVLGPLNAALDHYVCLTKFRTNASGQIEIGGRNSWGMGWGEDGNFWLSADAVAELGALVAADFRRAP